MIKIITENRDEIFINYLQYKEEVLKFVQIVEDYYKESPKRYYPKNIDRDGYIAFWNEWNSLKQIKFALGYSITNKLLKDL